MIQLRRHRRISLLSFVVAVAMAPQVARAAFVNFYLNPTDMQGNAITHVETGDKFLLTVYVQDSRPVPPMFAGVTAAYLDVVYDASQAMVVGDAQYSTQFPLMQAGSAYVPGVLDEFGAMTELALGRDPVFLLSVPFMALDEGTMHFTGDPADDVDWHPIHANMMPMNITPQFVDYGSAWINVNTPIPEPATAVLACCGAAGLCVSLLKRRAVASCRVRRAVD